MPSKKILKNSMIRWMINTLMRTLRWQVKGLELLSPSDKSCLLVFWHDELALTTYCLHRNKITPWAVVSQHSDGQIIADILSSWQFRLLRGSTQSKGAVSASKKMLTLLQQPGNTVILTGDGPRGPRHQVKSGSIRIAQRSGADIILMRASAHRYWRLRSWDQFIIPKPFSRVDIILEIAPRLDSNAPESVTNTINKALMDLSLNKDKSSEIKS